MKTLQDEFLPTAQVQLQGGDEEAEVIVSRNLWQTVRQKGLNESAREIEKIRNSVSTRGGRLSDTVADVRSVK